MLLVKDVIDTLKNGDLATVFANVPAEDNYEKIHALDRIMVQVSGKCGWEFSGKMLDGTAVFRLEVRELTCKAK